jgi:hydroxymethylbilane synthase
VPELQVVRLGTRGSPLARWQAEWVADQLRQRGVAVQLILIQTTGDVRSGPIGQLATQGVFTKEIQRALICGEIDLAVHSLKDLPTEPTNGLTLGAVPIRAAPGDALLAANRELFAQLQHGARVGTGSPRRRAQLLHMRPDLQMVDVRGNVDTRVQKLRTGQLDALVLAEAGLQRLNLSGQISEVFDPLVMLPAVGQGALGLEIRRDDSQTGQIVQQLNDPQSFQAVRAERALLAHLRGGCLAPLGAWGRFEWEQLRLDAAVLSADGRRRLHVSLSALGDQAEDLGVRAAEHLLNQGAAEMIAMARKSDQGASS